MEYIRRVVDNELDLKTQVFNAINIVGPKGCGKTRTASERSKTIIEFQDEEKRKGYLAVAESSPVLLLNNEKPILFDEWQDAPKIWGTIRKYCDDNPESTGEYYLTGSSSKKINTPHTGTGRISELKMYPMTLWESGESAGNISISGIFEDDGVLPEGKISELKLEDLIYAACRGGWPRSLAFKKKELSLEIARDYYRQIYEKDISAIDGIKRDPDIAKSILWSYARNVATTAKKTSIFADIKATKSVSDGTISTYISRLEELFVLADIDAWTPQIRSKTAIRSSKKHIFIDPSIAVAALGLSPEYFYNDFDLFGHIFENLVLRDLIVYAEAHNARIMHYTDDSGLEADAIYQMADGRYALLEIKTGESAVTAAEKGLLKFRDLIRKHNVKVTENKDHPGVVYREPSFMAVIQPFSSTFTIFSSLLVQVSFVLSTLLGSTV